MSLPLTQLVSNFHFRFGATSVNSHDVCQNFESRTLEPTPSVETPTVSVEKKVHDSTHSGTQIAHRKERPYDRPHENGTHRNSRGGARRHQNQTGETHDGLDGRCRDRGSSCGRLDPTTIDIDDDDYCRLLLPGSRPLSSSQLVVYCRYHCRQGFPKRCCCGVN